MGVAPFTMACLYDPAVSRELGDGHDEMTAMMHCIQDANDMCTAWLETAGYNSEPLWAKLKMKPVAQPVFEPHSQERIKAMVKASTHGGLFCATGGGHLTCDDMFKSFEVPMWEREIKEVEKTKQHRFDRVKDEMEGKAVLALGKRIDQYFVPDLEKPLLWYGIPKSLHGNQPDMLAKWTDLCLLAPHLIEPWTEADEAKLEEKKKMDITLGDTALGRLKTLEERKMFASFTIASKDEREQTIKRMQEFQEEHL